MASALLAAAMASVACVMPDQIAQIQKDVADVRQEVRTLSREQADSAQRISAVEKRIEEGTGITREEFADLRLQVSGVETGVAALDDRVVDLQRRMDRLSQDLTRVREAARRGPEVLPDSSAPFTPAQPPSSGPPDIPVPGGLPSSGSPAPDALYSQAYADFSKGNFALAVSGFEEYATTFPESDLADNALYWVGECRFSEGDFRRAVEAFDRMLERYPDSDRAAAANLKKGLAYLEENDLKLAIVQLRYVTSSFPSTDEAKIAREKLVSLGAGR